MHSKNDYIAIDMGGTKVHVALVNNGSVIRESKFPTSSYTSKKSLLDAIIKEVLSNMTEKVKGIGIGLPGLVDEQRGIAHDLHNIKDWNRVPLKEILSGIFSVEISIANDANLFALGEHTFGEEKECNNLLGIALGTGIGSGLILNDKPYTGKLSGAGEIGSIPYLDKTIEDYCSGKFFQNVHNNTGEHFARLAAKNDPTAIALFNEFGIHLGKMIKLLLFVLAPDSIVFGGSISKSYPFFKGSLNKELEDFPFKKVLENLRIAPSSLDNAALLGAAFLAQSQYEKELITDTRI